MFDFTKFRRALQPTDDKIGWQPVHPRPTVPTFPVTEDDEETEETPRWQGIVGALGKALMTPPAQMPPMMQAPPIQGGVLNRQELAYRRPTYQMPQMQYGGVVKKKKPVIVGDGAGPEVFVPEEDGVIIPNPVDIAALGVTPRPMEPIPQAPKLDLPAATAPDDYAEKFAQALRVTPEEPLPPATPKLSPLEKAEQDYASVLAGSPEKTNKWLNGLYVAMQAARNIFSPQQTQPIQSLGQVRKADKVAKAKTVLDLETVLAQSKAKRQKDALEIEQTQLENIGKRLTNLKTGQSLALDPLWNVIKEKKTITQAEADYLNNLTGSNIFREGAWQEFIEKTDQATGKSLIRPKTDPRYSVNPTISPDTTVPPVSVKVGDIPLTLKQPKVADVVISENQANAQREQQSRVQNANNTLEAARANASAMNTYHQQSINARLKMLEAVGGTTAASGEAVGIANRLKSVADQMQGIADQLANTPATPDNEKTIAQLQKQFSDLQKEGGDLQGSFDRAVGKSSELRTVAEGIKNLNIPKPQTVTPPSVAPVKTQTVTPNTKTVTKATVREYAKANRISYEEALRQAKADGYTIQ